MFDVLQQDAALGHDMLLLWRKKEVMTQLRGISQQEED